MTPTTGSAVAAAELEALLAALIAAIGRDPEVRAWRLEREANAAGSEDLA